MPESLSPNFTLRSVTMDDIEKVLDLYAICGRDEYMPPEDYIPEWTAADLRSQWQELHLATDAWVIVASDGQLVGYTDVTIINVNVERTQRIVRINFYAFEHPDYHGHGIGATLLQTAEQRALQLLPNGPCRVQTWVSPTNSAIVALLEQREFLPEEHAVQEMRIRFDRQPAPPQLPEHIHIRSFIPGQDDVMVKATIEEAFAAPFNHWNQMIHSTDFDPTLWYLACEGDQIAGALLSVPNPETGYIDMLGVRPAWRKQGLGMALLLYAFNDYYRRGYRITTLNVNPLNETGAVRLYERAGMYVTSRIDAYAKDLTK